MLPFFLPQKRFVKKALQILVLMLVFFTSYFSSFASVKSFKQSGNSVLFYLDKGLMQISICKDDIVEVKYTLFDSFAQKKSLVVNAAWANTNFTVKEESNNVVIRHKTIDHYGK